MSQGYGYAPPTLEEAIKSYKRAKEKAALIERYGKDKNFNVKNLSNINSKKQEHLHNQPIIRARRRGYSQGSISEVNNSDETDTSEEFLNQRRAKKTQHVHRTSKRREPRHARHNALVAHQAVPAWPQAYPINSLYQYNPYMPSYPNLPSHLSFPAPVQPSHYMNSIVPSLPYFYPQQPPQGMPSYQPNNFHQHPYNMQYNVQPAEPMNHLDFQRDCKFSPAPSRPYSDSDLLETLSKHSLHNSDRFSVIPPIRSMDRSAAAKVIQRNYRGYKDRAKSGAIKEKFYSDYIDKLIDDLLVEELLPDILVEVLLYGVKDVKLPSVTERVVIEYSEQILDECVHDMLRMTANSVLSEILAVYAGKKVEDETTDVMVYVIDELIAMQIREVVQEFLREYIVEFQCERVFNQMVYETTSVLVCEVLKEEFPEDEDDVTIKKSKPPFDLDNIILASVLCKSLVPNEDYILDGVIAQGLANQLKLESSNTSSES